MERSFWCGIVELCEATILSEIKNEKLHAYLLSESSLFVWSDRVLMLTCGETKLARSALRLIKEFGTDEIDCLTYQRKNEYRSELQSSHFDEDVRAFQEVINGKALRFGKLHGHYNLLFHTLNKLTTEDDTTTELLMYHIDPKISEMLTTKGLSSLVIRDFFNLNKVFPDFIIDDYVFDPYGYSLNAIKGHLYFTIHVTPQVSSPYVSFETNMLLEQEGILKHFIDLLKPDSFDVVSFNELASLELKNQYVQTCYQADQLECGFDVHFKTFQREELKADKPLLIK